jgi:hypothetical protein
MVRFKVEDKTAGAIASGYYHNPEDIPQSITDYLEDMFGDGWELIGTISETENGWRFLFKANGRNS